MWPGEIPNALAKVVMATFALGENMELDLETKLSRNPALESIDSTALTEEQQKALNQHMVSCCPSLPL